MKSVKDILDEKMKKKRPVHAKHEWQDYGVWLSEQLHDSRHKALYIKMAKEKPRALLEQARVFATDYNTHTVNRGRLFMWKLQQLEIENKKKLK